MKLQVIKQRNLWWAISSAIILAGLISMVVSWTQIGAPLRPSLDFVGGTRLQLELDCSKVDCSKPIDLDGVRSVLKDQGLGGSSVQQVGDQGQNRPALSIRTNNLNVDAREKLLSALQEKVGAFNPQGTSIDSVGATLGRQIFSQGLLALLISFVGITVYLAFRFQFDYAVFAIVALVHDVLVTVGAFSILGLVAGIEVDSLFIVALLTIVGFSVNDTVVIYDRVREVIQEHPDKHINQVVDDAVNQTLTRSINTTLTTLLTLFAIFIFGGETLKNFALALIIGFAMGAYSSIFIASSLLALWREKTGKAFMAAPSLDVDGNDAEVAS
ncbi:protein translocase subunit SecF [Alkalinema sp. FACHB-956]|uniref:protein translocase subunit SecF n=1 Tax=Alkalinema sp. FACHB-956 TaxID=2692768 RepID=UPI001687DCC4|nr:protein translocase subunit SecF [Alkalinema sp. FACHB-956]MBD2328224.1 protein translocase subunit SecF [Alkalinema sp. FACHB-956]